MASFMSMQYDSDSDSEEDLDFEPASEASSCSDGNDGSDMDDVIEGIVGESPMTSEPSVLSAATASSAIEASARKTRKKSIIALASTSAASEAATEDGSATTPATVAAPAITTATTITTPAPEAEAATAPLASAENTNPSEPGEVVKKKKGPKKGTKYKKRTPVADGSKPAGKTPKMPKMTKKAVAAAAVAAAAAAAETAQNSQLTQSSTTGRIGFQNTQVDMEHPLESFKWPYSPFTAEFKTQHQARNKMASDLHQSVQQMTETNGRATWHLQELDHQLQMSRQDLRTSLDEIQFRKSQLRDMSLLAVDIVRKLSSPRPAPMPRRVSASSSGAVSGTESVGGAGGYASSYQTTSSHLDGDRMDMDVDSAESGWEQYHSHAGQQSLKGLNEGNVRSFLEKIRELEQAQRHVTV